MEVFLRQDFQPAPSLCGIMGNQSKSAKTPQRESWIFTSIAHVRIQLGANFICSIRSKYEHRENIKDQTKAEELGTWVMMIRVLLSCVFSERPDYSSEIKIVKLSCWGFFFK